MKRLISSWILLLANVATAGSIPDIFDNGAYGITFFDRGTTEAVLGEQKPNCRWMDKHLAFCFQSSDGSEKITLSTHEGGIENEIAEIEIRPNTESRVLPAFPANVNQFQTTKQIHLGMTTEELKTILGEPHEIKSVSHYQYRIDNNPYFLDKYNQPIYYAYYLFEKDKLIEIRYGFQYVVPEKDVINENDDQLSN